MAFNQPRNGVGREPASAPQGGREPGPEQDRACWNLPAEGLVQAFRSDWKYWDGFHPLHVGGATKNHHHQKHVKTFGALKTCWNRLWARGLWVT